MCDVIRRFWSAEVNGIMSASILSCELIETIDFLFMLGDILVSHPPSSTPNLSLGHLWQ
jgi:hypothetical protein